MMLPSRQTGMNPFSRLMKWVSQKISSEESMRWVLKSLAQSSRWERMLLLAGSLLFHLNLINLILCHDLFIHRAIKPGCLLHSAVHQLQQYWVQFLSQPNCQSCFWSQAHPVNDFGYFFASFYSTFLRALDT
jgi:hypothetical protein